MHKLYRDVVLAKLRDEASRSKLTGPGLAPRRVVGTYRQLR